MSYPIDVTAKLNLIYEDLMWLARRPHVTACRARAWYSQVFSVQMAPKVRRFTGRVSRRALAEPQGKLCLEHYDRLSFSLSRLIENHLAAGVSDPAAFLALIEASEQVNITTDDENHMVQKTRGDYAAAGIELLDWATLPADVRAILWQRKLKGRVANAAEFAV